VTGTVVTFYSYKGGVGRSSTLANVAVLLARWGYRVLAIDWDLEAPGLHYYFDHAMSGPPAGGVVDLAHDFRNQRPPRSYEVRLDVEQGTLALLAAGRFDADYPERVQSIDWADLYDRGFAAYLEERRAEWTDAYDFVLIDSRTGISDTAGICTAHLPDRLVVVFTANDQNLQDVVDIAKRADRARDGMPFDRPKHMVLPVLSRLDSRVEYKQAETWQRKCAEAVGPLFSDWLAKTVSEEVMVRHLTLPYVSYWSFGEQLPVLEELTPSADQLSYALETVAAVIAQHFDRTDLLADNRDAYVAEARARHDDEFDLDLLVSSPRSAAADAADLVDKLIRLGLRADQSLSGLPEFLDRSPQFAKHLCLVVDGEVTRWQVNEAEHFLRQTLAPGDGQRQLFLVLTRAADRDSLPGFLRNLRPLKFGPGVARELHELITASPDTADPDRETLRDAASVLRNLPTHVSHAGRLALLRETVASMATALNSGDLALLQDLSVDLELLSKTRGDSHAVTVPADLTIEIRTLLDRIDRRLTV
jgi:MinD-like ATPase involved in chromosome partitioning or flagellar assembly